MPLCRCCKTRKQRGDILAESMIGVLLFAIAGMGISHVASKVSVSQRDAKVQHQVVNEMRSMVLNRTSSTDLCSSSTLTTQNFSSQVSVSGCAATTATINGVTINNVSTPVVLSAQVDGIGEIRVGGQAVSQ